MAVGCLLFTSAPCVECAVGATIDQMYSKVMSEW